MIFRISLLSELAKSFKASLYLSASVSFFLPSLTNEGSLKIVSIAVLYRETIFSFVKSFVAADCILLGSRE